MRRKQRAFQRKGRPPNTYDVRAEFDFPEEPLHEVCRVKLGAMLLGVQLSQSVLGDLR